jgi:hypothetical protein
MNQSEQVTVHEGITIVIGEQVRFISCLNNTRWLMSHEKKGGTMSSPNEILSTPCKSNKSTGVGN